MRRTFDLCIALSTVLLAGCADSSGLSGPSNMGPPPRPSLSISDAAHSNGTAGFYFLPPLVAEPKDAGVFDPARSVVVTVCPLGNPAADTCVGKSVTVSGPMVGVNGNHYQYNWQTDETAFPSNLYYRVSVVDNTTGGVYGHVDVFLGSSGKGFHSIDQTEFTPLLDGRTVPVKFRINSGAHVPTPPGSTPGTGGTPGDTTGTPSTPPGGIPGGSAS